MARHLDLEEQEQLDQIKHFWHQYGNLLTWALIVVLLAGFAGWSYWHWQRNQATQAAAMYDEVDRVAQAGDLAKLERALSDMREGYGSTIYAQQAGLLAAKVLYEKGRTDAARAALTAVAEHSSDEGYQAVARLRLAGLLLDAKAYDDALKQLSGRFPKAFEPLVADRKGDIHLLQGQKAEAKAEYVKAYAAIEPRSEYRRLIEAKLNALGVNVDPQVSSTANPAPEGGTS